MKLAMAPVANLSNQVTLFLFLHLSIISPTSFLVHRNTSYTWLPIHSHTPDFSHIRLLPWCEPPWCEHQRGLGLDLLPVSSITPLVLTLASVLGWITSPHFDPMQHSCYMSNKHLNEDWASYPGEKNKLLKLNILGIHILSNNMQSNPVSK